MARLPKPERSRCLKGLLLGVLLLAACAAPPSPSTPSRIRLQRMAAPDADDVTVSSEGQKPSAAGSSPAAPVPKKEVLDALQRHWPDLRRCYLVGSTMDTQSIGGLAIRFAIFADGSVAETRTADALTGSGVAGFASCVAKALRAIEFEPPGGEVQVTYIPELVPVTEAEVPDSTEQAESQQTREDAPQAVD